MPAISAQMTHPSARPPGGDPVLKQQLRWRDACRQGTMRWQRQAGLRKRRNCAGYTRPSLTRLHRYRRNRPG